MNPYPWMVRPVAPEGHSMQVTRTEKRARLNCACGWEKVCNTANLEMYRSMHYVSARVGS